MEKRRILVSNSVGLAAASASIPRNDPKEVKAQGRIVKDTQDLLKGVAGLVSPNGSIAIHNAQVDAQRTVKNSAKTAASYIALEVAQGASLDSLVASAMAGHPIYSEEQLRRAVAVKLAQRKWKGGGR